MGRVNNWGLNYTLTWGGFEMICARFARRGGGEVDLSGHFIINLYIRLLSTTLLTSILVDPRKQTDIQVDYLRQVFSFSPSRHSSSLVDQTTPPTPSLSELPSIISYWTTLPTSLPAGTARLCFVVSYIHPNWGRIMRKWPAAKEGLWVHPRRRR